MKKTHLKKLTLSRETLRLMDDTAIRQARGGVDSSGCPVTWHSCPAPSGFRACEDE